MIFYPEDVTMGQLVQAIETILKAKYIDVENSPCQIRECIVSHLELFGIHAECDPSDYETILYENLDKKRVTETLRYCIISRFKKAHGVAPTELQIINILNNLDIDARYKK